MLPTEIQRILLLIGLAATGYLMILAWNEDYMQNPVAAEYSSAPEPQPLTPGAEAEFSGAASGAAEEFAAGEASVSSPAASDVPDESLIASSEADRPAPTEAATATDRLIKTLRTTCWN